METNGNGNGKLLLGIFLTIIGVIIVYAIGVSQKWWRNIFSSKEEPEKSEYEKCVESNKSKADGAQCSNCVPEGSAQPAFQGKIVNGVCQQPTENPAPRPTYTNKIRIIKQGGTRTFATDSTGNIVSPQNANMVPEGTVLTFTKYVTSPSTYYETQYGWIDGKGAVLVV